jgi:hypothetical protein
LTCFFKKRRTLIDCQTQFFNGVSIATRLAGDGRYHLRKAGFDEITSFSTLHHGIFEKSTDRDRSAVTDRRKTKAHVVSKLVSAGKEVKMTLSEKKQRKLMKFRDFIARQNGKDQDGLLAEEVIKSSIHAAMLIPGRHLQIKQPLPEAKAYDAKLAGTSLIVIDKDRTSAELKEFVDGFAADCTAMSNDGHTVMAIAVAFD